jgi:hypothetical protein
MRKRVLVAEPDPDVRTLLALAARRAGHDTAAHDAPGVDAIVMEPGCPAPAATVAYVLKPATPARVAGVLADVLAA